jgi:hypothetical protein
MNFPPISHAQDQEHVRASLAARLMGGQRRGWPSGRGQGDGNPVPAIEAEESQLGPRVQRARRVDYCREDEDAGGMEPGVRAQG